MSEKKADFFVGYLAMPADLKRFYGGISIGLLILVLAFAYWVSSLQQAVGHGQWLLGEEKTYRGYLSHQPYPVLHSVGDDSESIMLMLRGKYSAEALTAAVDGSEVKVTGFPIERGGWKLLELRSVEDISVIVADPGFEMA